MNPAPRPAWRYLPSLDPADGPTNMSLDAALLESVRSGAAPALRLYRWSPATLSFGRNQPAAGLYDSEAAAARRIAFVRRPTGGQAVLHDDELTYAVAVRAGVLGGPRATYHRINEALAAGLRSLGVAAAVADPAGRPRTRAIVGAGTGTGTDGAIDWMAACFARPAPGEVVAAGRKLVGSAQRCEQRTILQHGSILVGGSQAAAEALLRENGRAPTAEAASVAARSSRLETRSSGWTTIEAQLGARPSWDALATAVSSGFEDVLGISLAPDAVAVDEAAAARRLRERYAADAWTWRR